MVGSMYVGIIGAESTKQTWAKISTSTSPVWTRSWLDNNRIKLINAKHAQRYKIQKVNFIVGPDRSGD